MKQRNKLGKSPVAVDHEGRRHEQINTEAGRLKALGSCVKGEEMSLFLIRAWGPLPDGHTSTGPLRGAGAGEALNATKMG